MQRNNDPTTRLRNIDLNLLKVFNAVLIEQSISKAASILCVSQPAVSNALRRLRELYNDPLFVRTANGMIPTPKAQELSGPIGIALSKIDKTIMFEDRFLPATSRRVFNISLTDYGEFFFLPRIVNWLKEEAPGLEVICLPDSGASLTLEMKSGAVDLVWDWVPINDPDYTVEPIFEDSGCCLVRKGHPLINGELSVETFLEVEHVALLPTKQRTPRIEQALGEMALARKVVAEVSHLVVMPQIVATTDLVATIPARLAHFYGKTMDLQVIPNPVYQDSVIVYQMWHKQFEKDEGHRWFRELTKKVVADT